ADADGLAAGDTLRAVYIDSNLAQARLDPASGEVRGPAADLTRELAKRNGLKFTIRPAAGVAGVIAAVKSGEADIGFVAYDATRAQEVDFSQTYLLAHNTYIVREDSSLRGTADLDRAGVKIGVGEKDAADLFLTRNLKAAALHRMPSSDLDNGIAMLVAGRIDAYAANRTRLLAVIDKVPGLRLLPDNFYDVEQAIVVAKGNPEKREIVEKFVMEAKVSGLVQAAIDRAKLRGVSVAPAK
ncbi:MAG: transporter substrate-binding domain-containing protein, partial [Pseudorhodoplanes sp.]